MKNRDALTTFLSAKGYTPIAPKILWPAEHLVDVFGEELKKRLFLTTTIDGMEYALRPDFTVPVALSFIETGQARAQYSYCGTVFRQSETGHSGEFIQTGVEDFGATDFAAKDAEILALAVELCSAQLTSFSSSSPLWGGSTLNLVKMDPPHKGEDEGLYGDFSIQLGDAGLFTAVLDAVKCPPFMAQKLKQDLGKIDKLAADLTNNLRSKLLDETLEKLKQDLEINDILNNVEVLKLMVEKDNEPIGNRSPEDIAIRLHMLKERRGRNLSQKKIAAIRDYLKIECKLSDAGAELRSFSARHKLGIANTLADLAGGNFKQSISKALTQFEARIAAFEAAGIDTSKITFSGSFGRRLNYYSGFMFNISLPHNAPDKPLAGGGRYDGLLTMLGAQTPTPAVGFAVWNERFTA